MVRGRDHQPSICRSPGAPRSSTSTDPTLQALSATTAPYASAGKAADANRKRSLATYACAAGPRAAGCAGTVGGLRLGLLHLRVAVASSREPTIVHTDGPDRLVGTAGADVIVGLGGGTFGRPAPPT